MHRHLAPAVIAALLASCNASPRPETTTPRASQVPGTIIDLTHAL